MQGKTGENCVNGAWSYFDFCGCVCVCVCGEISRLKILID